MSGKRGLSPVVINFRASMAIRIAWIAALLVLIIFGIGGCKVEHDEWIDKMIADLAAARKSVPDDFKSEERQKKIEEANSRAVQKYFPVGMGSEKAFKLLRDLKNNGFSIGEYRHEFAKVWPDGEPKPYLDNEVKRMLQQQVPEGKSKFFAEKSGMLIPFLMTRHVKISFDIPDHSNQISEVRGDIWTAGP